MPAYMSSPLRDSEKSSSLSPRLEMVYDLSTASVVAFTRMSSDNLKWKPPTAVGGSGLGNGNADAEDVKRLSNMQAKAAEYC